MTVLLVPVNSEHWLSTVIDLSVLWCGTNWFFFPLNFSLGTKSEEGSSQDKPPSCSTVKTEINGSTSHEFSNGMYIWFGNSKFSLPVFFKSDGAHRERVMWRNSLLLLLLLLLLLYVCHSVGTCCRKAWFLSVIIHPLITSAQADTFLGVRYGVRKYILCGFHINLSIHLSVT